MFDLESFMLGIIFSIFLVIIIFALGILYYTIKIYATKKRTTKILIQNKKGNINADM